MRTKSPPSLHEGWSSRTLPALRSLALLDFAGGHVRVKLIGYEGVTQRDGLGAGAMSLPRTRLAPASPDRLVAALVIMIEQAHRNRLAQAATLPLLRMVRTE